MSETYLTYPAKLSLSQEQKCFLDDYAVLFGEVCRQYYAALKSGRCKSRKDYHVFTGQRLPYRVMRGVEQHLKGQIKSQETNRKNCIAQDENKLDTLKGDIAKLAKKVVSIAEAARKPVVIEKLDFKQKKRQLHKENPVYARMLSSLAYEKIKSLMEVNCAKRGLECITVNPAYSSQIGALKYKEKYGLSTHHAAALVIARRGLGFWDRPLRNYYQTEKKGVVSHPAPARKTGSAMPYYREFFSWKRRLLREIGTGMRFGEAVALAAGTQRRSLAS